MKQSGAEMRLTMNHKYSLHYSCRTTRAALRVSHIYLKNIRTFAGLNN